MNLGQHYSQLSGGEYMQNMLATANAWQTGAVWGGVGGLMVGLFLVKGRYILCIVGGCLLGGFINYKMKEAQITAPKFGNYGVKDEPGAQDPANT